MQSPVRAKIRGVIERKIADVLGGADQDLADFVIDHITQRKGPGELVDDLSAVSCDRKDMANNPGSR